MDLSLSFPDTSLLRMLGNTVYLKLAFDEACAVVKLGV
jgi:hypothetical protein